MSQNLGVRGSAMCINHREKQTRECAYWSLMCLLVVTFVSARFLGLGYTVEVSLAMKSARNCLTWEAGRQGADEGLSIVKLSHASFEHAEIDGSRAVCPQPNPFDSNRYLYFKVDDGFLQDADTHVVVSMVYHSDNAGIVKLQYDSSLEPIDTEKVYTSSPDAVVKKTDDWGSVSFVLRSPTFGHNQQEADFRLIFPDFDLLVREVSVTIENELSAGAVKLTHVDKDMQLTVETGYFHDEDDYKRAIESIKKNVDKFSALGFTSVQTYVHWLFIEKEPGVFDFSLYDNQLETFRNTGLKWVPFVICGSGYSLPKWWVESPNQQGYVCLEHNTENLCQSLWNPHFRNRLESFLKAFAEHYRKYADDIEYVILPITGDYGEAIYPAGAASFVFYPHGEYHTHEGWWMGDPYAILDFQTTMQDKYDTLEKLNKEWGTRFKSWSQIKPQIPETLRSDRARLDQNYWYADSMIDYTELWFAALSEYWPEMKFYICTGGSGKAKHGSDFGAQAKLAAEYGGGIRITNEGGWYSGDFSLTRWVASAGKFYCTLVGFEPWGVLNANGIVSRIYNATASGVNQLHFKDYNVLDDASRLEKYIEYIEFFQSRTPVVDVAVLYPRPQTLLSEEVLDRFLNRVGEFRDYVDFDYMDPQMILDGAFKDHKVLVSLCGNMYEDETLKAILEWVRAGGILILPTGEGKLINVQKNDFAQRELFARKNSVNQRQYNLEGTSLKRGKMFAYGDGFAFEYTAGLSRIDFYYDFIVDVLRNAPKLGVKPIDVPDGRADGIYVTSFRDQKYLCLSANSYVFTKTLRGTKENIEVTLEPFSILEVQ